MLSALPVLTRRQTLWAMAGIATFGLTGCGGGGHGGSGGGSSSASVAVQLPSGFTIASTDLVAGTAYGTGAVTNGTFKAKVSSKGPTFAYLQQKSTGAYVMVGLVGSGRPGLSALSSAALSVALALGITALPSKGLTQAMALLETDPNVQTLSATIATTMASDPLCLTNGNAVVAAAIKTAVDAVGGGAAPADAQPISRTDPSTLVLVQPTGDQGGAEVLQGDDQATIVPTNTKRRPISAYTYLVGHVDSNGTTTAVSPATRIDEQDIPATSSLLGSVASLGVKGAFGPVSGKAVALSVSSGDTKTLYETVALMATGDNAAVDPAFFSDAKYATEVAGWRTQLETLNLSAFVGGILFDLFNSVLAGAATAASVTQVQAAITAIGIAEASAANGILSAARLGKYGDAAQYILTQLTSNDLQATTRSKFRQAILELLGETEAAAAEGAAGAQGIAVTGLAAVALAALAAAGTLAAVTDVAASYFDTLFSPKGEIWTATAIKPSVVVSPKTAKIHSGSSLTIIAATPGISETNFRFHWTLSTGGNGNIGDPSGTGGAGHNITTTGNSINLLTAPSDGDGTIYTITVTAIDLKTGDSLGSADSTVTTSNDVQGNGTYFTQNFSNTYTSGGITYEAGRIVGFVKYPPSDPLPPHNIYAIFGYGPQADVLPTATPDPDHEGDYAYSSATPASGDLYYDASGNLISMPLTAVVAHFDWQSNDPMNSLAKATQLMQGLSAWTWTVVANEV